MPFEIGTIIYIEQKRKSGWWIGIIDGKRGYVPHNYIEEVRDENTPHARELNTLKDICENSANNVNT